MSPRKAVRDSIGYAATQFLVRAAMIARTVLAARWLGPQVFGAWNALQLLMDYGALAPLGTQQGLDQIVPRHLVDEDEKRLERVKRAGITMILALSLLFCAVWALYFSRSSGQLMQTWGGAGMLLAMAVVLMCNWAGYHTTLLRSHGDIGAVSLWFFLQGIIGAVLGLALVRVIGGWGLLWGWVAGTVVGFAWTRWKARRIAPLTPLVSQETLRLLQVGFPMFFFLASSLITRSLDRLIILRYLGTKELGFYSLAVTALTLLMYLPDSATYVYYPRLLQRFRAAGDRPEAIRESVRGVNRVLTALTLGLGGIAFLGARDLIWLVLPTFAAGATSVRVMCFTAGVLCATNLASIVLMTVGRQLWLMPAAVLSIVAFATADLLVLQAGYGISGVAWATFGAYAATGALLLGLALFALRFRPAAILAELCVTAWAAVAAMGAAFAADRLVPWGTSHDPWLRVLHLLVGWTSFIVVYALAVAPQLRGLGILQLVSELNLPFAGWLGRRGGASPP